MYQPRFQERSVVLVIVFSILSCGIYGIYWFYKTNQDLNDYTGDQSINPGLAILFSVLTCGLYTYYWWYKMAQLETFAQQKNGNVVVGDNKILYLVLAIFGLSIVNMAILQSDLNQIYLTDDQTPPTPNNFSSNHTDDEWTDY